MTPRSSYTQYRLRRGALHTGRSLLLAPFLLTLLSFLLLSSSAVAEEYETYNTPRFILQISKDASQAPFAGKSGLDLANFAMQHVNNTHDFLEDLFGASPEKRVVLSFLSPEAFSKKTGAPSWTSAMFYKDEISIPIANTKAFDPDDLERALRHEYVHAFIAQLSAYRCPAWLDEGLAQLIEGEANPLLAPALRKWMGENRGIPLSELHGGFTTLNEDVVPAAYAQSLFAARELLKRGGYPAISSYLKSLARGTRPRQAFAFAFGKSQASFEKKLETQMLSWASKHSEL